MGFKIELLGLCGVGKTTFLKAIKSKLVSNMDLGLAYPIVPPKNYIVLSLKNIISIISLVRN